MTIELYIDRQGFTWKFYTKDHHLLAEWSMKEDPKGGFRGTKKGDVADALRKAQEDHPDSEYWLEPLIVAFEEQDIDDTMACDVCRALNECELEE